jgi:phosphohistidine phosphatase SixA
VKKQSMEWILRSPKWVALMALSAIAGCSTVSAPDKDQSAQAGSRPMVILVRHAEKSAEPGNDPPLSAAGAARAGALAVALRDARVTAVITTQFRRTRETAQPIADALRITPRVISAGSAAAHVEAVAAAVRQYGEGTVLVVGHGNTVPAIIAALGGPRVPDICESAYSNLFTLMPGTGDERLVRARYGAADPDGGPECK